MATTLDRPTGHDALISELPLQKHAHRGLSTFFALMLILTAVMALIVTLVVNDRPASTTATAAPLKLTPKEQLPVIQAKEGVNWTHAPNVPPRITRSSQARLVVNWTASEFTNDLDPANGVRYAAWGFEGSVPGPLLRARASVT
jgi:hypothetical protein